MISKIIIQMLKENPNVSALSYPFSFSNTSFEGYIDFIKREISNSHRTYTSVANDMGIDSRVFGYIKSRTDSHYRHIQFYEALRLIVVLNLSITEGLYFLTTCNFLLVHSFVRDNIIFEILRNQHTNPIEMTERLQCIDALESNEPDNTNSFNYIPLFEYIGKQYSKKE